MRNPGRRSRTRVTIDDVARRAGVSAMTVSRVVNAGKNVHPATRELVLAAMRELHYAPSLAARSLARADEVRIGLIYADAPPAGFGELLVGALDESTSRGAQLMLVKSQGPDAASAQEAVQRLIDGGATGAVLTSPLGDSAPLCERLTAAGVPGVAVGDGRVRGELSCVRVDERRAALDMTRLLLDLGHRRIGFIQGPPDRTASAERLAGFAAAVAECAGCEIGAAQGLFTFQSGLDAAAQILEGPLKPTAVFASSEEMAAAAVSAAQRRFMDVPNDLTVVGFGDTGVATTLRPALTTIRQPVGSMAAMAIDLLLREIRARREGEALQPTDRVVAHAIVQRDSSGPPRPPGHAAGNAQAGPADRRLRR